MTASADAWFAIVPEYVAYCGNPRAVQVFAIMHRHADKADEAWPSRKRLAELAGCTPKTIDRAIAELEEMGAVTVERRHRDDGSYSSNLYTLHMAGAVSVQTRIPFGTPVGGGRETSVPRGRVVSVPRVESSLSRQEPESVNQSQENHVETVDTNGRDLIFEAICYVLGFDYQAPMPKTERDQIGRASAELKKIGATPDDVIQRAAAYRVKHPTWDLTPFALVKWWNEVTSEPITEEAIAKARRAMVEPTGRNLPA